MIITPEDLKLHKKWINREPGGVRLVRTGAYLSCAVLRDADLRGADLRGAVLRDAVLRDADLRGADLSCADLRDADLRGAYLSGADLRDADLSCADLRGADLSCAVLRGADLRDADLRGADLRGAVLRGADLRDAVLRGADLSCADLRDAVLTIAEDAADRLRAVACVALASDDALRMDAWHSCGTSHCIAGWAIHQAGEVGRLLEASAGAEVAGLMLLGTEAHSHFFDDNEKAREYLQSVLAGETND